MIELYLACRRIEHKDCSTVVGIKKAAQTMFSNNHGAKILKSLKDLIDGFADSKAAADSIKDRLPEKKARAVKRVKEARKEADQYLDKIEVKAYHERDAIYKKRNGILGGEDKYLHCLFFVLAEQI